MMNGSPQLSRTARREIENSSNQIFVSIGSIWEAAIKFRSGKLPEAAALLNDPQGVLTFLDFTPLPLQLEHAKLAGLLSHPHKDPFDRMLAAQTLLEGLTLVSADAVFDTMLVTRLW
jgi:PIN domain nuclease of toxin-antitoxin system